MTRSLFYLPLLALALAAPLHADEQTKSVQSALKDQGFYYGAVDGQMGTETSAAIRRYQIRNGLEVTGKLSPETLTALKATGENTPPAITSVRPSGTPEEQEMNENSNSHAQPPQPDQNVVDSDQRFLKKKAAAPVAPPDPAMVPEDESDTAGGPPPRFGDGAGDYRTAFARTPYQTAPREVQDKAFRRAQAFLARGGFYAGPIDGNPGRESERAIIRFQMDADLQPTGRLDMDTLGEMNLLPGRPGTFPTERVMRSVPARRVIRGIWIH